MGMGEHCSPFFVVLTHTLVILHIGGGLFS